MDTSGVSRVAGEATREFYRKRFPYTSVYNHSPQELETIQKKFDRWYVFIMAMTLLFLAAFTVMYGWLFYQPYFFFFTKLLFKGHSVFLYQWPAFCIPGFLFACASVSFPVESLQRLLMGDKYEIYNDYYSAKQGYDNARATKHITKRAMVASMIVLFPFITSFLVVNQSNFTIKQFYQLYPHTYPISQIQKVNYYARYTDNSDKERDSPHYKIVLKNGNGLNTIHWNFDDQYAIVPFIGLLHNKGIMIDSFSVHRYGASFFNNGEDIR